MNSRFKIEETVTIEDWEAYSNTFMSHKLHLGGLLAVSRAEGPVNGVLGILLIVVGGFLLLSLLSFLGNKAMYPILPLIIFMCASSLFFGIRMFQRRKPSKSRLGDLLSRSGLTDAPMEFWFEDDAFFVRADNTSSSYRYHALSDVWESGSHFYLFCSGKMQYILRKDAFTQGDPEQFREFIQQKTGKAVEYAK